MKLKTIEAKSESSESRFAKVKELRKFHQSTLDAVGASDAEFIPKMAYVPKGMHEVHIGFFPSELTKAVDIFTEFVNKDLQPEDKTRQLYMWKYNPYWENEYPQVNNGSYTWCMVPVSELYKVSDLTAGTSLSVTNDFEIAELNDAPISELSIRDLAAILLKKPVSNKKFLNDIISK